MTSFKEKQILTRAEIKVKRILPLLSSRQRIIDIGSGNGGVCKLLRQHNFYVTPMDVTENRSLFPDVRPIIFDGRRSSFPENSFDVALLLTVLHHTINSEELIMEALRVAKKVIITEDVYTNSFQKYLTFFVDSLVNWQWFNHPHTNKSNEEWKLTFEQLGLKIEKQINHPGFLIFFRQVTYVLRKNSDSGLLSD